MAAAAAKLGFTLTAPRLSLAPSPKPIIVSSCPSSSSKLHSVRFIGNHNQGRSYVGRTTGLGPCTLLLKLCEAADEAVRNGSQLIVIYDRSFELTICVFSPSYQMTEQPQFISRPVVVRIPGFALDHNCSVNRRLFIVSPKATADQPGQIGEDDVQDGKILQYCNIDKKQKKSIGELEQEFLQALQGKAIMSNEEFDNLKEELMWEGSSVVMLSSDEQKFLEASMAYVAGNPILSDKEFDDLKVKLKTNGSEIVVEGPRCSLRSRKVYSDLSVDYLKMFLLNVPAAVIALGLFFFLDDITGFEITYLLELPEPFSFIFTWFAAIPLIVYLSTTFTSAIVKDFLILKGACPNCGTENTSFYGTILSISSGGATNKVKCSNCATELIFDSKTRLITLPEGSEA